MVGEEARPNEPTLAFVVPEKEPIPTSIVVEEEATSMKGLNPVKEIPTGQNAAAEQRIVDIASF